MPATLGVARVGRADEAEALATVAGRAIPGAPLEAVEVSLEGVPWDTEDVRLAGAEAGTGGCGASSTAWCSASSTLT